MCGDRLAGSPILEHWDGFEKTLTSARLESGFCQLQSDRDDASLDPSTWLFLLFSYCYCIFYYDFKRSKQISGLMHGWKGSCLELEMIPGFVYSHFD